MNLPRMGWRQVEIGAFLLLAAYFCGFVLPRSWRSLNTDFPNYYLAARLAREGVDTARAYEWKWIEREKDHRGIDQRVVGLVPITPFSTLLMYPVTKLAPLNAKHLWIALNLGMLVAVCGLLSKVSGLSHLRAAILLAASFPLHRNLEFGQYYILLLLVLTAACWAAQKQRSVSAGILIGIAAALKVYPILLVIYFLRKRNWNAVLAVAATVGACVGISISVFGLALHRTYLLQVLPWTLRGDCLPPYNLVSQSLSSMLHRLFVYEPQWNPHPALNAAWLLAAVHPLLQALLLAPAALLVRRTRVDAERAGLEFAGLLTVALAISTITASYHFTVMILPVAMLCGHFLRDRRYFMYWLVLGLFLAMGLPAWNPEVREGWAALIATPRLYASLALVGVVLYVLARERGFEWSRAQVAWAATICAGAGFSIATGLRHQHGAFDDYQYRVPIAPEVLIASDPAECGDRDVVFIALRRDGYHATTSRESTECGIDKNSSASIDRLSLSAIGNRTLIENVDRTSVARSGLNQAATIENAESPVVLMQGRRTGFLRSISGKKELFVLDSVGDGTREQQLTFSPMNVYEASATPTDATIFSAAMADGVPRLYLREATGDIVALDAGEARYPTVSPDGSWLAYSSFTGGNWNLYLRDMRDGVTKRLTDAPCNQIEASWKSDSKTLLYATDCGRALWFTAIAVRRVVP